MNPQEDLNNELNPDEQEMYLQFEAQSQVEDSGNQLSILLDNIIKYYTFYNGGEEIEDSDKWKQLLDKQKKCPDHIHQQIEQAFTIRLKTVIKKEKQEHKALNK